MKIRGAIGRIGSGFCPYLSVTFIRFVLVGGLSSISYSLLVSAIVSFTELPAFASSVVLFVAFIPVTFRAHKVVTFVAADLSKGAFIQYALLQVSCFSFVSFICSRHVTNAYFWDAALYFAAVTISAILSFLIGRYFIFRSRDEA
ncbi:MAG: hypothetical protein HKP40_06990 [Litoreibacter sp.]|nr:hypothetical protein [Litoreibacter sp.]